MTCRRRSLSALVALFVFLFAQGAVAAHACAEMKAPPANEVITHHESCHEMIAADGKPVTGNVCVQHCQYGDTSVDNVQPSLVAAGLEGPILRVDLSDPPAAWGSPPGRRPPPAAAPPPPAILFGILRI